jgi:hypothetical protein
LFVPTQDQLNVHEASKPSAIGKRAELGKDFFTNQVRRYGRVYSWIAEYLYAACELPNDESAARFEPTPSMLEFRKEARIQAILHSAQRSEEQLRFKWAKGKRSDVSDALLSSWRCQLAHYDWYDHWQLRGKEPPDNARVVTTQQARRISHALDFRAFCRSISSPRGSDAKRARSDSTYVLWIRKKQIPDLHLLKWLYGLSAPDGVYVVSEALQSLKHEQGRKGILDALKERGIPANPDPIWRWQRDERTRSPIKSILARGKGKDGGVGATGRGDAAPDDGRRRSKILGSLLRARWFVTFSIPRRTRGGKALRREGGAAGVLGQRRALCAAKKEKGGAGQRGASK